MRDPRIEEIRQLLPRAMLPDWVHLGSRLVRLLRDSHHADTHDAVLNRLLDRARQSVMLREERRQRVPTATYPPGLPITNRKDEIVAAIRKHQVIVLAGETGSGKTTQLPKMCLEAGFGIEAKVGCTQPRRVAALSISRRISEELNVEWGREVGCKIRFDDRSSPETYIKLMTDGILLAETQGDPLLSEYNALIIDEAHERSLNIDFLLGYLKGLLAKRPELKLIITSATIDTEAFSRAFNQAPVLEVSGRVYPVEVEYAPFDSESEDAGEMTYIDAAVNAAERVFCEPGDGDVLIFMPSERDIRETTDQLKSRFAKEAEIIPLFGRLGSADQQRVFVPSAKRKLVVATNIAETSLTIPGIRYVIDSGLARVSRYNARTRTRRLPIEPVAQSSANQRKGRSGRVRNGVCIRLYSEQDFGSRPPFTQPEIQRANLAEVILRMKAFRLGEIETFPFLNPPSPAAIQGGYKLLQELGALDENHELTPLGRDLARLPIDPTLGRMLLQAQKEHATRELLIIAAGLSIQDPRERPLDQKDAADSAHRRFAAPESDFLSLLNIWNAVHEQWEALRTQNQRRKFCKANFLSYVRMREWQDLHAQLRDALEDLGNLRINESNAAYEAIHRSILAGLLGHIAQRTDRNTYKAVGNRQLLVFPGSSLFTRAQPRQKSKTPHPVPGRPRPEIPNQPEWLVAGEIVETSQLFARTVAGIDPLWIIDLAPHLCRVTHQNPHWSAAAGRVLAEEKTTLYGFEIRHQKVAYGNINPQAATEIFVRSALVEEDLFPEPDNRHEGKEAALSQAQLLAAAAAQKQKLPAGYQFIEHNRHIRQKVEIWQTRMRRHDLVNLDQALFDFYRKQIENISSLHELNRLLGSHPEPGFLRVSEADLLSGQDATYDAQAFPDAVPLGGHSVPLSYAYSPGEERDGVTVKLELNLAHNVAPATVEWAVPGLREAQVAELLRALPKTLRRQLMPFAPKVAEITRDLQPTGKSLKHDLSLFIRERYGVDVTPSSWAEGIPPHLRPRIEIVTHERKTLGAGRDLDELRKQLEKKSEPAGDPPAWTELAQQWERFGLREWNFGDVPEQLVVSNSVNAPLYAWPGLELEEDQVNLRIFRDRQTARRSSLAGIQRLVESALQKDLAWLQKDLRALAKFEPLLGKLCSLEELQVGAYVNLKAYLLPAQPWGTLVESRFRDAVQQARSRLPGLSVQLIDRIDPVLKLRHEILRRFAPAPQATQPNTRRLTDFKQLTAKPAPARPPSVWENELQELLPPDFLRTTPFEQLTHMPRYLKALLIRAERASLNPLKDQERARQLAPYREALRKLTASQSASEGARERVQEFRWMVEEYKVSVFAQELGTAIPVSPKRLDQALDKIRHSTGE